MGACLVSERLGDILQPGQNGSTFGGNPIASAAARVVVRRVSEPDFLQSVLEKGAYFREKLEAMPQVEYVRGRGLMLGVKLKEKDAHDVLVQCAKAGLLILTAKELVRFLPPLTITQEDIDQGPGHLPAGPGPVKQHSVFAERTEPMKHLLKLLDLTGQEILDILNLADQLKYETKHGIPHPHLQGKCLGMIFEKSSTRTRVSFEVGINQLGGYAVVLGGGGLPDRPGASRSRTQPGCSPAMWTAS